MHDAPGFKQRHVTGVQPLISHVSGGAMGTYGGMETQQGTYWRHDDSAYGAVTPDAQRSDNIVQGEQGVGGPGMMSGPQHKKRHHRDVPKQQRKHSPEVMGMISPEPAIRPTMVKQAFGGSKQQHTGGDVSSSSGSSGTTTTDSGSTMGSSQQ